ncbi:MAG: hypothetical protein, partial [Olavius algarvensis Gamma 1 endosymbiont]
TPDGYPRHAQDPLNLRQPPLLFLDRNDCL